MPVTWPASLPQYIAVDGYSAEPAANAWFTELAGGRVRGREHAGSAEDRHVLAFHMDLAQLATFRTFWRTTLKNGTRLFQGINDPLAEVPAVWRAAGRFTVDPIDGRLMRVSFPAVVTGDPVFTSQEVSVDLDGSTERFRSNTGTVGVADAWSVAFWYKRRNTDGVLRTLLWIAPAGLANQIATGHTDGEFYVSLSDSGGNLFKELAYAGSLPRNQWTHLAVTFDGSEGGDPVRVYANGILLTPTTVTADTTGTMTDTSRRIFFGAAGQDAFGYLHSIGVWASELASYEVSSLYYGGGDIDLNVNRNGYASAGALKHWYRLGLDSTPDADIGQDYAATPHGAHNLMDAGAGVTAADLVSDIP